MGAVTTGDAKVGMNGKRMLRSNSSTRHTTEWPISDASSDLTVEIGTTSFSFHKLPLISRSGRIRKLLSESKDPKISKIKLPSNTPGGAPAFELVAKFSFGISIELTLSNIATLRCLAHVLEMTEDISEKNLEAICESFITDIVLPSISNCIFVLHQCQSLIPISDDINLVSTLIQAIANNVTKEQYPSLQQSYIDTKQAAETAYMPYNNHLEPLLRGLNLDFFHRLVTALTTDHHLSPHLLIHYANASLNYPNQSQTSTAHTVETLTSLLPSNPPIPFLSGLLKHAIASSASIPCISDLERRIGSRLDDAILEDVLIPAKAGNGGDGNSVFDVDAAMRIFAAWFDEERDEGEERGEGMMVKVGRLMDSFIAEVAAAERGVTAARFVEMAEMMPEMMPESGRVVADGLYRAIDIFLKVHPDIKDADRLRLCKTIDYRKLSPEACTHAAQNERLPTQMAVQVLYIEQTRLRDAMNHVSNPNNFPFHSFTGHFPMRSSSGAGSGTISPMDNYASVRIENRELKLEVARMRMRLSELEKDHLSLKQEFIVKRDAASKFMRAVTTKLNMLKSIFKKELRLKKSSVSKLDLETKVHLKKRRHHSIS
ncbi:BTB/POZ domain-containing protein [Drosera capensis]